MILHRHLPEDMRAPRPLPGILPVQGDWLRVDEAYADQMSYRIKLLETQRADVLICPSPAVPAAQEVLDLLLDILPDHGFNVAPDKVRCPDGRVVLIDQEDPLGTAGQLVQCDLCLLHKPAGTAEHVLGGAILCFPASWTLAEKVGRPMLRIHQPVEGYAGDLSRRVQRLLDGIKVKRPLWRFNRLFYGNADLYQPRRESDPPHDYSETPDCAFFRAERQTLVRLPQTDWVLFAIHTYVLRKEDVVTC